MVDRIALLQKTEQGHPGINQVAIEKDWWVTAVLKALFQTSCHESLIFKGGTSASSNFVSADFRKMRTDSFQKSRTTRFRNIRVVR